MCLAGMKAKNAMETVDRKRPNVNGPRPAGPMPKRAEMKATAGMMKQAGSHREEKQAVERHDGIEDFDGHAMGRVS